MFANGWALVCILQLVICMVVGQDAIYQNMVLAGSNSTLRGKNGNLWGLRFVNSTFKYMVTVNDVVDQTTEAVILIALVGENLWQQNEGLDWWAKTIPTDTWLPRYGTKTSPLPNACVNATGGSSSMSAPQNTCHGYGICTYYGMCNCTHQTEGFGGAYCNTCSNGFTFPQCNNPCGNGRCEMGETCLTCPQDCQAPCGCGDGVCAKGETCSSCPLDCQCQVPCKGSPVCSGKGTCQINGVCECNDGFSGPTCSDKTVEIAVNLTSQNNASNTNVQLHPSSTSADTVTFYIGITEVDEITPSGTVVQHYLLPNITQSFTKQNQTENGSIYVATEKLGPSDILFKLTLYIFTKSTVITFAGQDTTYASGSIKLTVEIGNWPFQALSNSIMLKLLSSTDLGKDDACHAYSGYQQEDELKWVQINNGQNALYVQFQSTALVDDFVKPLSFKWLDNGITGVTIPHFWKSAVLDPSYQILLDSDKPESNIFISGCGSKHKIAGWKIAVVVIVIVAAIAFAVGFTIWRKHAIKRAYEKYFNK